MLASRAHPCARAIILARNRHLSAQRFEDRVDDYVRFRPSYPAVVVRTLESELDIDPERTRVVDLGCGTGISAQLFLAQGYRVLGVEPNVSMREAAVRGLGSDPRFQVVDGTAEATRLPDSSFDLAVAAQSFHWFDRTAAREEIGRILAPSGVVALLWNERKVDVSPFLRAYEDILLQYGTDYVQIDHRNLTDDVINNFFGPAGCDLRIFSNHQDFDLDGLIGRAKSSSYVPGPDHHDYDALLESLTSAYVEYAREERVRFEYDTKLYFGRLSF